MGFCRSIILSVSVLIFAGHSSGADESAAHAPTTAPSRTEAPARVEAKPNLHRDMDAMGRLFKSLRAQVADATKNEATLALVNQMQQLTFSSKTQLPPMVAKMPTTQKSEETTNYRQMMITLLRQELDLEEQLLNSDNKKAAETLAAMDQTQKDGHKEFRPQRAR